MFKDFEKEWTPMWRDDFSLSKNTISKLRYMSSGTYNAKSNAANIRLAIEDLIEQVKNLLEDRASIFANHKGFKDRLEKKSVFFGSPLQIKADINEVYNCLVHNCIVNEKKKPLSKTSLLRFDAWSIIAYYNSIAYNLLFYFCGVDNLNTIKKIVASQIRDSLLQTLAHKHKCSYIKILSIYGKEIKATNKYSQDISFISLAEILSMKKGFFNKKHAAPTLYDF
jgi:Type II intron maturase